MTPEQLTAAQRFAPPLFGIEQADRRGARLRTVNRRAADYARSAGATVQDIYPQDAPQILALAPPPGTPEAAAFAAAAGLGVADVYPLGEASFSGEPARATPARPWRWGWAAAVGALVGAVFAGPFGAVAGGLIGGTR